jgi:hypothetical protein
VSDVTRYSLAPTFSKSYPGSNHNRRSIQLTQLSVYPDQLRLLLAQPKLLRYVAKYQGMRERPSAKWFIATHGISNDPPSSAGPLPDRGNRTPAYLTLASPAKIAVHIALVRMTDHGQAVSVRACS